MKADRCAICGATDTTALWWHVHRDQRGRQTAVYCGQCTNAKLCPCYDTAKPKLKQMELPT